MEAVVNRFKCLRWLKGLFLRASQVRPSFRIKARRIAALDVKRLATRRDQETLYILRKALIYIT